MKKRRISIFIALISFLSAEATTYYVVKSDPCSSDSNNGLSYDCGGGDGPFYSIEHACNLLANGDSIVIGQGTYFEHPIISNVQHVTIVPYGDGIVTISGAMEAYTLPGNNLWSYEGTRYSTYHDADFAVYYSEYPAEFTPNPSWSNTLVQNMAVDDTGKKLYTYVDSVLFTQRHQLAANGEGVYFDYDKMYISFQDQTKNPNDVGLFISAFWEIFYLHSSCDVTIDGGPNSLINIDHSGRYAVHAREGARVKLKNINFKNGHTAVYSNPTAGSVHVENCDFKGGHDPLWTWTGVKDCFGNPGGDYSLSGCYVLPDETTNPYPISGLVSHENFAILLRADTANNLVRNCRIEGYFNGIAPLAGSGLIEGNHIWNIYDDALEPEGQLELIIRNNTIWDAFVCHAGVTTQGGPVYVYENIYCASKDILYSYDFVNGAETRWQPSPLKYYGTSPSEPATNTHFYYNTVYGVVKPLQIGSGGCLEQFKATNSSLYNNIFLSDNHIASNSGLMIDGIEIRSNLLFSYGNPIPRYACWNGTGAWNVLPPMPSSWTGNVDGNPLFQGGNINSPLNYFQITEASLSREVNGFELEPIPLGWPGALSLNNLRSNAGAIEYNYSTSQIEMQRLKESINVYPNPSSGHLIISLGSSEMTYLTIFSVAGEQLFQKRLEKETSLELTFLPAGIYFMKFVTVDESFSKALVIQ